MEMVEGCAPAPGRVRPTREDEDVPARPVDGNPSDRLQLSSAVSDCGGLGLPATGVCHPEARMSPPWRVLIADDRPPMRQRLRKLLEADGQFQVCDETADAAGTVAAAVRELPQLCLIGLRMPGGGAAAAWEITSRQPRTRVVLLTAARGRGGDVRGAALGRQRLPARGHRRRAAAGRAAHGDVGRCGDPARAGDPTGCRVPRPFAAAADADPKPRRAAADQPRMGGAGAAARGRHHQLHRASS